MVPFDLANSAAAQGSCMALKALVAKAQKDAPHTQTNAIGGMKESLRL